jgi:hypothetical protein
MMRLHPCHDALTEGSKVRESGRSFRPGACQIGEGDADVRCPGAPDASARHGGRQGRTSAPLRARGQTHSAGCAGVTSRGGEQPRIWLSFGGSSLTGRTASVSRAARLFLRASTISAAMLPSPRQGEGASPLLSIPSVSCSVAMPRNMARERVTNGHSERHISAQGGSRDPRLC